MTFTTHPLTDLVSKYFSIPILGAASGHLGPFKVLKSCCNLPGNKKQADKSVNSMEIKWNISKLYIHIDQNKPKHNSSWLITKVNTVSNATFIVRVGRVVNRRTVVKLAGNVHLLLVLNTFKVIMWLL